MLTINDPCNTISWTNGKPTERSILVVAFLLAAIESQPAALCNIYNDICWENSSIADVLTDRSESGFFQQPLICIDI